MPLPRTKKSGIKTKESVQEGQENKNNTSACSLQSQLELEIKEEFKQVIDSLLVQGIENNANIQCLTKIQKRTLVGFMQRSPNLFQKTLFQFIDRIVTLEIEDMYMKNFYRLIEQLILELMQPNLRPNGPILVRQIIQHVLDLYHLPKLLQKTQLRCSYLLALLTSVSSATHEIHIVDSERHFENLIADLNNEPQKSASQNQNANYSQQVNESDIKENQEQNQFDDQVMPTRVVKRKVFNLLDFTKNGKESKQQLMMTVEGLLSPKRTLVDNQHGIVMAALVSDFNSDSIFKALMHLLANSRSADIRKRIIKSFKVPYSGMSLAFLGKRLRDKDTEVVHLLFTSLRQNGVTLKDFPDSDARMLLVTEGLTHPKDLVKKACIDFLKPTILTAVKENNLASLFEMVDARRAFLKEYFGRVPSLLILAVNQILETIGQTEKLFDYLEQVIIFKLRKMANLDSEKATRRRNLAKKRQKRRAKKALEQSIKPKKEYGNLEDLIMSEEGELSDQSDHEDEMVPQKRKEDNESMQDEEQDQKVLQNEANSKGYVTNATSQIISFEEILFLRLSLEISRNAHFCQTQQAADRLDRIVPEFEDYNAIVDAITKMPELNLPKFDPNEEIDSPYPKGQIGFTRRAILGEWVKFSVQMNIQDEIIRNNLTTLCFRLISRYELSFDDYEHLLRKRKQIIRQNEDRNPQNSTMARLFAAEYGGSSAQNHSNQQQPSSFPVQQNIEMNDEEGIQRRQQQEVQQKEVEDSQYDAFYNEYAQSKEGSSNLQNQNQNPESIEINVQEFKKIGVNRTLQEYCKPWALDSLCLDFDDVCQVAVVVVRTLLGSRIEDFQTQILQAISDLKDLVPEELASAPKVQPLSQPAMMVFSQIPGGGAALSNQMPTFKHFQQKFEDKMYEAIDKINTLTEQLQELTQNGEATPVEVERDFQKNLGKVDFFLNLLEEANLKYKLTKKLALTLCRSLLKQCRLANINDQNVIELCEEIIHPAVKDDTDQENYLLSFECIGLLGILDTEVFSQYCRVLQLKLEDAAGRDSFKRREKVLVVKSIVDGLLIHGASEVLPKQLFNVLTSQYLMTNDRVVRQVVVEGVCKMLFTTKLCDQSPPEKIESILANLVVQLFERTHMTQNSLIRSILNQFFLNFVHFSEERCFMLLNALLKVTYSALKVKYQIKNVEKGRGKGAKVLLAGRSGLTQKNQQIQLAKRGMKRGQSDQSSFKDSESIQEEEQSFSAGVYQSESESVFEEESEVYSSDDSEFKHRHVTLLHVYKDLDLVQVLKICMMLLQRTYVNQGSQGQDLNISQFGNISMKSELSVIFLARLLELNNKEFNQTRIVKEVIVQILENVSVENCDSLPQIEALSVLWDKNMQKLVQKNSKKIEQFNHRLSVRQQELEEIYEEANMKGSLKMQETKNENSPQNGQQDAEMTSEDRTNDIKKHDQLRLFKNDFQALHKFFNDHIDGIAIQKGRGEDPEVLEMQKVWLKFAAKTEQDQFQAQNEGRKSVQRRNQKSPGAKQYLQTLAKSEDDMSPSMPQQKRLNKVKDQSSSGKGKRQRVATRNKKINYRAQQELSNSDSDDIDNESSEGDIEDVKPFKAGKTKISNGRKLTSIQEETKKEANRNLKSKKTFTEDQNRMTLMKSDISEEEPEQEEQSLSSSVNNCNSDASMAQITKKVARNIIRASNERKRSSSSGEYDHSALKSASKNVKLNPDIQQVFQNLSQEKIRRDSAQLFTEKSPLSSIRQPSSGTVVLPLKMKQEQPQLKAKRETDKQKAVGFKRIMNTRKRQRSVNSSQSEQSASEESNQSQSEDEKDSIAQNLFKGVFEQKIPNKKQPTQKSTQVIIKQAPTSKKESVKNEAANISINSGASRAKSRTRSRKVTTK